MSNLREALVRAAYQHPEIRDKVLPLLKQAYNEELEEVDSTERIKEQVADVIKILRLAVGRPPRLRMMIIADASGRLMDAIETEMTHGDLSMQSFGMRQLRELRDRLRTVLGK